MYQNTQDKVGSDKPVLTENVDPGELANAEPDFNLIDVLIALGQEKIPLLVVTALATITGVIVSLITPPTYASRATIMPSQQSVAGGALASLGGLAGLAGLGSLTGMTGGIKSSDEMFIALMRSQSVQSSLIDQLKLKERYGARSMEDARQALTQNVTIVSDKKSGLIIIEALDKDANFAAQLANAQVNELNVILSRLAVTEAQQRRAYYDHQIVKTQEKIPQLEQQFKEAQKRSGLEVASLLSESGTLPGQIAAKELQIQVLSRFATPQNPDLRRIASEITALRTQLAKYELSQTKTKPSEQSNAGSSSANSRASDVQQATQAYNTLKIQEALLDGFVKQLELAKVDEAKEGPAVQVVDEARASEIRAKPERKKLVLAYTVTGFCIALLLAALRAWLRYAVSTAQGRERLRRLKNSWSLS